MKKDNNCTFIFRTVNMVAYLICEELKRTIVTAVFLPIRFVLFLDLTDFVMFQKFLIITIEMCVLDTPPMINSRTELIQKPVLLALKLFSKKLILSLHFIICSFLYNEL